MGKLCIDQGSVLIIYVLECSDFVCKFGQILGEAFFIEEFGVIYSKNCGDYNCNQDGFDCLILCTVDFDCLSGYNYICVDVDGDDINECIIFGNVGDFCAIDVQCKGLLSCSIFQDGDGLLVIMCCDGDKYGCCNVVSDCLESTCTDQGSGSTIYSFKCINYVCEINSNDVYECGDYNCNNVGDECLIYCKEDSDCLVGYNFVCVDIDGDNIEECIIFGDFGDQCSVDVQCIGKLNCSTNLVDEDNNLVNICCSQVNKCCCDVSDCGEQLCIHILGNGLMIYKTECENYIC